MSITLSRWVRVETQCVAFVRIHEVMWWYDGLLETQCIASLGIVERSQLHGFNDVFGIVSQKKGNVDKPIIIFKILKGVSNG